MTAPRWSGVPPTVAPGPHWVRVASTRRLMLAFWIGDSWLFFGRPSQVDPEQMAEFYDYACPAHEPTTGRP